MLTSTSSPSLNGIARSSMSSREPSCVIAKWSSGRPSEPSKWKILPVSSSSACRTRAPSPVNFALTRGLTWTRNASVPRLARARDLAQLALELDRDRVLGLDDALAVARRARPGHDLADALGHVLARHLDQAELGDLGRERLRPVLVERLAQRLEHGLAVLGARHVDEVDDDDPADVAQPQLADDLVGRLQVGARDRVLQAGLLAAPDERAGVDVDDRQRLGVVDQQVAAGRQVDPLGHQPVDDLLDVPGLEQRLGLLPQLDAVDQLGRGAAEERDEPVVLLLVVDDRLLEVRAEDVAHDADRAGRPPGRPSRAPSPRRRASRGPRGA